MIISHNHYDHLDYNSVIELNKKFGNENSENGLNWFVGEGEELLCNIFRLYLLALLAQLELFFKDIFFWKIFV